MIKLPFLKSERGNLLDGTTPIVALDIGTETVKSILFTMNEYGVSVNRVSRIQQQQHAMRSGIITNLDTVLENCKLAINQLLSNLKPEEYPKKVIMGIAGEYVQGVSIVVNYEREQNFEKEVTKKEQDRIIAQVRSQIAMGGKEDLSLRTGLKNEDIEILHITPTGLEIGGMPVNTLVGYKGRDVRLNFYASFAPKTYTQALRRVASSLNFEVLGIVSQPFAIARAHSGGDHTNFSAIFIDIGGGTTDVAIVKNGNVAETQMFAFGGRVFTKELAKLTDTDFRHAEQRKIKYSEKDLPKEVLRQVQRTMYSTATLWMRTLKVALESCEDIDSLPTQLYLCGGGALLPDIKQSLMEFPWKKYLPIAVVPKIDMFTPNLLGAVVDNSGELSNLYDITPASLAKFLYDMEIDRKKRNINWEV
ncbi:MAG: cell division protein FtsA [candidate division WS6 bacterium GW2011_GWC1_33_20]|uniref:Cell division protein (Septum formation) n=2 Tax=Candidatus Dojkabacteria TaxID=74243 RepID=A0A0G0DIX3_9BACT|nr:MAG: cell division protein FtsA [candidate division WS6 bacterium GW2011_GWE2_33_157]KKP44274.1 MAG: cell division protein FtsA [candidate division WS6 bacterium GW2011_GWC1_33_20]KKP45861.1 MAG: cell division protein FtsA [candidate division WS6 bacterium GW2011_GWF1_33_233]KKP55142.1 MAG: cell division protein FtsA [candidate division WS6 bacterium GW2011_WS6_33_547]KKP55322.1 MAG: cell division protein (septum formation) [candidate division WS6 bacterium GW2011_GWB1_33_6]KKP57149.1 MAG: 